MSDPAASPSPDQPGGPSPLLIVAAVLAVAIVAVGALRYRQLSALRDQGPLDLGPLPAWSLTEARAMPVTDVDLRGHVYVADFVFTRCAGPCVDMTRTMLQLQRDLLPHVNLRFVSVTVDPEHDTPEVLRAYAEAQGADPKRWLFLTGGRPEIERLVIEGFKLPIDRGKSPFEIAHSSRFVLVDQRGHVRGYYPSDTPDGLRALKRDVAALLRDADPPAARGDLGGAS